MVFIVIVRQYHLPHITSLNIYIDECQSWMIKKLLEVMFQGCDLRKLQTLVLDLYDDIPLDYYDRLLNLMQEEGHHIKSI